MRAGRLRQAARRVVRRRAPPTRRPPATWPDAAWRAAAPGVATPARCCVTRRPCALRRADRSARVRGGGCECSSDRHRDHRRGDPVRRPQPGDSLAAHARSRSAPATSSGRRRGSSRRRHPYWPRMPAPGRVLSSRRRRRRSSAGASRGPRALELGDLIRHQPAWPRALVRSTGARASPGRRQRIGSGHVGHSVDHIPASARSSATTPGSSARNRSTSSVGGAPGAATPARCRG